LNSRLLQATNFIKLYLTTLNLLVELFEVAESFRRMLPLLHKYVENPDYEVPSPINTQSELFSVNLAICFTKPLAVLHAHASDFIGAEMIGVKLFYRQNSIKYHRPKVKQVPTTLDIVPIENCNLNIFWSAIYKIIPCY
jgi:hypothetical protein